MSLRNLPALALVILAFSAFSPAQSLGDLARQLRAERQQNPGPPPKVFTNDDIASPSPAPPAEAANDQNETKAATQPAENAEGSAASKPAPPKSAISKQAAQENEIDQRTEEINRRYLDRIAAIRAEIDTDQKEVAKVQREQAASTFDFQRTLGVQPTPGVYEEEQRTFSEQIKALRDQIASLSAQLDDAKEAARHAGVPHATD